MKLRESFEVVLSEKATAFCKKDRNTYRSTYTVSFCIKGETPKRVTVNTRSAAKKLVVNFCMLHGLSKADIRKL